MTDRELMQQALQALEFLSCDDEIDEALIVALRHRLAQPEHDWQAEYAKQVELHNQTLDELRDALAQPEQEPVAWVSKKSVIVDGLWETEETISLYDDGGQPLYTAPPQRTWVGSDDLEDSNSYLTTPLQPDPKPFEDLAAELFVVAQQSPADDGFSDTINRIEAWLRKHFTIPLQPEQEPVAWPCHIIEADFSERTITLGMESGDYKVSAGTHYLSTTQPQRTWVGLTDEEMVDLQDRCGISIHQSDFEAIEAKLKEKNT